jgi:ubiquinone/menaquinone biosynthesis C-methylase UbiE
LAPVAGEEPVDCISFDRVANIFDRTRYIPSYVLRRAFRIVFEAIILREEITILDAGVGTGRIIQPLMQRKLTLIGVDISVPMLSQLKRKYVARKHRMQLHIIVADVAHLPIRSSSIYWIQSTHVLHLLKHWKRAVREWQRVVRPDGVLVVLQESGQRSKIRFAYDQVLRHTVNYRRRMVYSKVFRFLKQNGWRVRQSKIRWIDNSVLTTTFRTIENRSYSRQWNLPDEVHEKALTRARNLVTQLHSHGVRSEKLHQELLILTATRLSRRLLRT